MVPTVSYKDLLRISKSKAELRAKIKENIQQDSTNISMVAEHLMCSRTTLYKILRSKDLEFEKNRKPLFCPHKLSALVEQSIVDYSIAHGYGSDMVKVKLEEQFKQLDILKLREQSNYYKGLLFKSIR